MLDGISGAIVHEKCTANGGRPAIEQVNAIICIVHELAAGQSQLSERGSDIQAFSIITTAGKISKASMITTFVPLGICESEFDNPLLDVRPPVDGPVVGGGVVPLSAKTGTAAMALNASTSTTVIKSVLCRMFLSIAFSFGLE